MGGHSSQNCEWPDARPRGRGDERRVGHGRIDRDVRVFAAGELHLGCAGRVGRDALADRRRPRAVAPRGRSPPAPALHLISIHCRSEAGSKLDARAQQREELREPWMRGHAGAVTNGASVTAASTGMSAYFRRRRASPRVRRPGRRDALAADHVGGREQLRRGRSPRSACRLRRTRARARSPSDRVAGIRRAAARDRERVSAMRRRRRTPRSA